MQFCLQSSEWESDRYTQPDLWLHKLPLWLKKISFHSLGIIKDIIDMFVCKLSAGTFYARGCQIYTTLWLKLLQFLQVSDFPTTVLLPKLRLQLKHIEHWFHFFTLNTLSENLDSGSIYEIPSEGEIIAEYAKVLACFGTGFLLSCSNVNRNNETAGRVCDLDWLRHKQTKMLISFPFWGDVFAR